jgi:hypothetical protein
LILDEVFNLVDLLEFILSCSHGKGRRRPRQLGCRDDQLAALIPLPDQRSFIRPIRGINGGPTRCSSGS